MNINWQAREINIKIVYYGAALSGKTTNLEKIYQNVDKSRRSELVSLKTHGDRTLFFDFLQLELGKIGSLTPKVHLYTVPGQSYYEASRRMVMKGVDGVVFVVDSDRQRIAENQESFESMQSHLASYNLDMQQIPIVIQYNKQDLPGALHPATLAASLKLGNFSHFPAVAAQGIGVFDTLRAITRNTLKNIQQQVAA
jgi:signal recognition particle receptor subunit beta